MPTKTQINQAALAVVVAVAAALAGCEPLTTDPSFTPALKPVVAPTEADIRSSIARGVRFLIDNQQPDGRWGSLGYQSNVLMPSWRDMISLEMATTCLCVKALVETDDGSEEVQAAIDASQAWLLSNVPRFRRQDQGSTFNNWGHTYAIEALLAILEHRPLDDETRQTVRRLIADQIHQLTLSRSVRGGWGYYEVYPRTQPPSNYTVSFLTAAALTALHRAQEAGFEVPVTATATGLEALRWSRLPNGACGYHIFVLARPLLVSNRPPGALARTQACNLAFWLYDDPRTTRDVLKGWLFRLFRQGKWLDVARKAQAPHAPTATPSANRLSPFVIAGYYYYFGYYYAAQIIEHLDPADQPEAKAQLARVLVDRQDQDGCWWDFVMFGFDKPYGTAYALMSLQRCLPGPELQ